MNFGTPTSKANMYEILQQIFHYYRIERNEYEETVLEELNLERMTFNPLSDEELLLKAQVLLKGKHEREIQEYKSATEQEIAKMNAKITSLNSERTKAVADISLLYTQSEEKVERQAQKNGVSNSSIVVDKITALQTAMNNKISETYTLYAEKISECQAEITRQNTKKAQAESYFASIHEKEISAKAKELKDEQDETQRTVFKYNNSLEEKEIRYRNTIKKSNAELKLKYLDIKSSELSRDELVDMGYYDDALTCVCAFYDRLSVVTAYQDILLEERLMTFLDDQYQNLVYMYKLKAGA